MDRPTIILNFPYGRLGNRLRLYSNLIAFAINHQVRVINLSFFEYYKYFKTTQNSPVPIYPDDEKLSITEVLFIKLVIIIFRLLSIFGDYGINKLYYLLNLYFITFYKSKIFSKDKYPKISLSDPEFLKILENNKTIVLQSWEHTYTPFFRFAEDIRSYFVPTDSHMSLVNQIIEMARTKCDILIGVHIRHGDYKQFEDGKYFFSVEEYYNVMKKLLEYFPKGKKITFLICSDEKQDLMLSDLDIVLGTGHLIEDLYLLSKCDYIVGCPSTYNMWASFHGSVPLYHITKPNAEIEFSAGCYSSCH